VQLDRDTVILQRSDTVRLHATLRDSTGAELDRAVTWSTLTPANATVSQSGLVAAQPGGAGSARIVASAEGKSDTATIRVPGVVASVTIDVDTMRLEEPAQQQLSATARDAEGLVITGRATIWSSSDPDVASVGALGLVTAIRPGSAEVRARVDGDTGRAAVIVTANHAYDLVFGGWSGTAGEWPYLYRLDMNQPVTAPAQLSHELGVGDFAISPDGSHYIVAGKMSGVGGVRGLYLMNRDGSNPTLLLNDSVASQPAWSPDGAKIAFRHWPVGGGADIMIMDADGTDVVNLTAVDHGATSQHTPAFSPMSGGSYRIAYAHSPGPTAHIWTMKPDGSDKQQLTTGDVYDESPTWAPDGRIAFQRTGTDIFVVPAAGGTATAFVSLPGSQFAPAWSPDGMLLAFASKAEAGTFEIFTIRANGTGLARRTVDPLDKQEPAWLVR
jgi:Big-like domain-containing protein/WD40 repeat protein